MPERPEQPGPDPRRVHDLSGLARELGLLRARAARGHNRARISLDELARRIEQPRSTVHAYVTGKHLVPADVLDRIVIALGATPAEQRWWSECWFRLTTSGGRNRAPVTAVPRQLPPEVAFFTGRAAELAALDQPVAGGQLGIQVITGTGGVGKTALAVHWAHRHAASFPDGHLCVDLRGYDPDQPMPPADALAGFLRALGVAATGIPVELAERAALFRSLVAGRRMLVLLDNVRDSEQARPLLPGTASCLVMVTSRDRLAGLVARHGGRRVDLDLLPLTDAITLLRLLTRGPAADTGADDTGADTTAAAARVAEQCARLPLALRVAAERAAATGAGLGELADELGNERRRLDLLDAGDDPRTAVRTVFSWSYRHLPAEAARLFRLLGLHPGRDLSLPAAAALAGTDVETASRLLGLLVQVHLVYPAGPGRVALHDLLRTWAAETTAATDPEPDRVAAWTRLLDHQVHGAATAVDLLYPAERYRRPAVETPATALAHLPDTTTAKTWLDNERANLVALASRAAAEGWTRHVTRLSAILWRHLDVCGHYADAERLHQHALSAAARDEDRAGQAVALANLGVLHWRLGRHSRAITALRLSLEHHQACRDRAGEARSLNNLGGVYWQLGDTDRAAEHFERALRAAADSGEHISEAVTIYNLALVHALSGRYQKATECCLRALAVYRTAGDRVGEASAVAGLGIIATRLGHYDQAAEHFDAVRTLASETGNRMAEARLHGHLGILCERTGRYREAAEHHLRELELHHLLHDPTGQCDAIIGLATVSVRLGRCRDAVEQCQRALALAAEIDHRYGLAAASNVLGEARLASGDPLAAVTGHLAAGDHAGSTGDRYEQARAHHGLGAAYAALGDHQLARESWRRALAIYDELGVPEALTLGSQLTGRTAAAPASGPDAAPRDGRASRGAHPPRGVRSR